VQVIEVRDRLKEFVNVPDFFRMSVPIYKVSRQTMISFYYLGYPRLP